MSSLGPYGGDKNALWPRNGNTNNFVPQTNTFQQQIMNQPAMNNMNSGIPYQQQQVLTNNMLNNMSMQQQNLSLSLQQISNPVSIASNQLFQQVGAVTYPNPRSLTATAFQTQPIQSLPQNQTNPNPKPRVFTGTVTTVHDNFGFVDEDVFFQTAACVKGSNPIVGDRVLVEASYNSRMPFKWNATRIQVLSNQTTRNTKNFNSNQSNSYNAVPPPSENGNFGRNRAKANIGGRGRERSRDVERDDDMERKKRRQERMKEREKDDKKSPVRRNRSRSPKNRRKSRIVPRYMVQIPKIALDLMSADVLETRHRYNNLYIPSDFFCSQFRWMDAFPPNKPFTINKPCSFHIMHKDVDPVIENDAVLEPPDADYLFSAKVMLMSVPGMEEIYQRCCAMTEDKDKRDRDSEERDYVHPTRLVNFLVGLRGKNETMAIGGPWSPSLDGENPEKDPSVLIKTAIRTCKALTGIDLSNCTKWYRFVELYYRRGDSSHKGKLVAARVETVVLFLPDVWSCLATRLEWDALQLNYNSQLERKLKAEEHDEPSAIDEKEEEPATDKVEPTHHSRLDPKTMTVVQMRKELEARNINSNGIKSQLCAKLTKALKSEAAKSEDGAKDDNEQNENSDEKKGEGDVKKLDEKERQLSEKRYTLPDQQHIIVHPSRTAKSGKFDCTVMSLSLLLGYRPEDTKEHSFEVSLFAELFNEMLMRDFGFNIYKALCELPEKPKEKDDKKKKDDEKKPDEKKKEDDEKKEKKEVREKKSEDRKSVDKRGDRKEKKEEKKSDSEDDYEEDEDKDKKKDKDRKKKERPKMFTKDKHLLLSFIYFDQTHCGYIFEKDIEDLLYTLGLNLSRAQVRKLVGKVVTRDSLHYRKLTDKPVDEGFIVIDDSEKECNLEEMVHGNKNLLPVFFDGEPSRKKNKLDTSNECDESNETKEGLIMFAGGLVDIEKLMGQVERSEKARLDTEARIMDLKSENSKLIEESTKSSSTIKSLNSELKDCKEKLMITEKSLHRITACSKLFQTTLVEIQEKIDLKNPLSKEEMKAEESKTRWEQDTTEAVKVEPIDIDSNEEKSEVK